MKGKRQRIFLPKKPGDQVLLLELTLHKTDLEADLKNISFRGRICGVATYPPPKKGILRQPLTVLHNVEGYFLEKI
jgi:hypothetical protein